MSQDVREILESVLPGNYWLSKSMEFARIESSGTLWYLKKWIVYYHFVFLRESLLDDDYQKIAQIFRNYIDSLPEACRREAEDFFFSIDIRDEFVRLEDFLSTAEHFANESERKKFRIQGKRFYFMYLLKAGGQSGFKKRIKELIEQDETYENMLQIINLEMSAAGKTQAQINQTLADFPAAIRNERQIFFYYGFFHGKDAADLSGFYNLTNVGKAVLTANFYELLIIWEHQKIRMVSQSPVADIRNLPAQVDAAKFGICNQPYVTLLQCLNETQEITKEQYKYVISKIKNQTETDVVVKKILGNPAQEKLFENKAVSFKRLAETNDEDFAKELKKFILGICDVPKDGKQNPFESISWLTGGKVKITNKNKFKHVLENYRVISARLADKNQSLYRQFEAELRNIYSRRAVLSDEVKYEWYKYIINFDLDVLLHLIYICISLKLKAFDYSLNKVAFNDEFETFRNLCELFKINRKTFRETQILIQDRLEAGEFYAYSEQAGESVYRTVSPRDLEKDVALEKIAEESAKGISEGVVNLAVNRERNINLINLMRSFYVANYRNGENGLIKCDACAEVTFLTYNEIPYLEFHHLIPFSTDFGPDHYLNLLGICPSCHKKFHFAKPVEKKELYEKTSANNNIKISLRERVNRLFAEKAIEPIHLDFLLKEKIITSEEHGLLMSNQLLNLNE